MRKFFKLAALITLLIAVLNIFGLYVLTELSVFRPGDQLFVIQQFGERQRARLLDDSTERALFELNIVERRLADLKGRTGSPHEPIALSYLDQALDRATDAIASAPNLATPLLRRRLLRIVNGISAALANLTIASEASPELMAKMTAKVSLLLSLFDGESPAGITAQQSKEGFDPSGLAVFSETNSEIEDPLAAGIPFQPGTRGAEHAFFPLIGQHQILDCSSCHSSDQFAGTPTQCVACHLEAPPANHFGNECSACHSPASWQAVSFDHSIVPTANCNQCHSSDKPANHYLGQCSACHNTGGWGDANFNHTGQTDCMGCHTTNAPANHYAGQCSACHNTGGWGDVTFNHTGQTDCMGCHTTNAPANHYAGQCSACHNTGGWGNANFNHTGQTDCMGCHTTNAPAKHYAGQCSACHNTGGWGDVSFNHAGQTNCLGCHANDAPGNHFPGQCSACHNTGDWDGASFNHAGQTNCLGCHTDEEPDEEDHPQGQQCSDCHDTEDWDAGDRAAFDHGILIDPDGLDATISLFPAAGSSPWTGSEPLITSASLTACGLCHRANRLEG